MKKKVILFFIAFVLILTIAACSNASKPAAEDQSAPPPPKDTPTHRPTRKPTPTKTLIPTYTPSPQPAPPTSTPPDTFDVGPFARQQDLDPKIFGPEPWYDAEFWYNSDEDVIIIEGWAGQVLIYEDVTETKTIAENFQLIGYDDDSLAYVIGKEDGMIYRVYLDLTGEPLATGWRPFDSPEALKGSGISTDIDGNIWLATHFDVRRFDGNRWTIWTRDDLGMYSPEEGMLFSGMRIHDFDMLSGLWMTSCDYGGPGPNGGGGARWWDGNKWQGIGSPVDTGCVTSVFQDSLGIYWVGVEHELWKYNSIADSWEQHPYISAPEPYYRGYADTIVVSPLGVPWVSFNMCGGASCYDFLLAYYHGGEWHFIDQEPQFNNHKLLIPSNGDPWMLSFSGVYRIMDGEIVLVSEISALTGVLNDAGKLWLVGMDADWTPSLWVEITE